MPPLTNTTRLYNPQLIDPFNRWGAGQYATRIIEILILILFIASIVAFFLMFLWGGFEWITSGGAKQKLEDARSRIANGITGLLVLFLLFVAIRLTNTVFGINFAGWGGMMGGGGGGGPSGVTPTSSSGLPVGSTCSQGSQCASGFCGTTVDSDGDGFFTAGVGTCINSAADCNDSNAEVFPGQTKYFENPIAGSFNDFNYDCTDGDGDGDPNDKFPRLNCKTTFASSISCQTVEPFPDSLGHQGWVNTIPACGTTIVNSTPTWMTCFSSSDSCVSYWVDVDCNSPNLCLTGTADDGSTYNGWAIRSERILSWFDVGGFTKMPCK